jgi:hypothetical protein
MPLSETGTEIPPSAVMLRKPDCGPTLAGVKFTVTLQLDCAARVAPQVVMSGNSAELVPAMISPVSGVEVPVFVKVTVCALFELPTAVLE